MDTEEWVCGLGAIVLNTSNRAVVSQYATAHCDPNSCTTSAQATVKHPIICTETEHERCFVSECEDETGHQPATDVLDDPLDSLFQRRMQFSRASIR
jgi:hypothetical protein